MNQSTIDTAVAIATRAALNGCPVARIIWIPPMSATNDPRRMFAIAPCPPLSASETPPWERY